MQANLHAEWGQRLRAIRAKAGRSQTDVAQAAQIDRGYYARIELGQVARGVSDDMRMRIAEALAVRVEDIWAYPNTRETR